MNATIHDGDRGQGGRSTNDLILAIDLGSSSVRASAYRTNGEQLENASAFRHTEQAADGTFEPQALAERTEQAVSDCLERVRRLDSGFRFIAVAWTSFAMSWLGVDSAGQPVTPIYTYADTRSGPYANTLRQELERRDVYQASWRRTGTPVHTAYAPAQLRRLADEEPEQLRQVAFWQTLAAYLLARWQGRAHAPISSSEAGWTGLLNRAALSWDEALLQRTNVEPEQLPSVLDYASSFVGLVDPWAERWRELARTPFFLAVGDGVGANLGSGCADNRRIALTIGTTGAMRVVIPSGAGRAGSESGYLPDAPGGLWSYPIDRNRWLVGGSLTDGGSLYSWLHEMFASQNTAALLEQAAQLSPDAHGLTILPFLRGERAPGWATEANLTMSGMTPATTPAHIVRAAFEAVAFRFRLIYDRLRPLLAEHSEIVASGGALQGNPLWRQILADVMQAPVHLVNVEEATSRGAALLALQALNLPQPAHPPTIDTALPDKEAGMRYAQALRRQEELYRHVVGVP